MTQLLALNPLLGLHAFIYKSKQRTFRPLDLGPNVHLAEAVIYEHKYPQGWYKSHVGGATSRKTARECSADALLESFLDPQYDEHDPPAQHPPRFKKHIAGLLLASPATPSDPVVPQPLTADDVRGIFANNEERRPVSGVILRFVDPPNALAEVITVEWSPYIFTAERRQCLRRLDDERYPLEIRTDPLRPSHSRSVALAPSFLSRIKTLCCSLVNDIASTAKRPVLRMSLKVQVDPKASAVWVLYCERITFSASSHPLVGSAGAASLPPLGMSAAGSCGFEPSPALIAERKSRRARTMHALNGLLGGKKKFAGLPPGATSNRVIVAAERAAASRILPHSVDAPATDAIEAAHVSDIPAAERVSESEVDPSSSYPQQDAHGVEHLNEAEGEAVEQDER